MGACLQIAVVSPRYNMNYDARAAPIAQPSNKMVAIKTNFVVKYHLYLLQLLCKRCLVKIALLNKQRAEVLRRKDSIKYREEIQSQVKC